MELDMKQNVMMEIQKMVMDVLLHALNNQDGNVLVVHLHKKVHAINIFLINQS